MSVKIYHPKGSMCMVCKLKDADCSGINFEQLKPMRKYSKANDPTVFVVVKCNMFSKH